METCAICRNKFESESPAVLFVSGYGNRRCLCPECESLLDLATSAESEEQAKAKETLLARAAAVKDIQVAKALSDVLSGAVDAVSEEEEAEMDAVFEEVKAEEGEAEQEEKPSFLANVLPVAIIAAFALFLLWFYFLR